MRCLAALCVMTCTSVDPHVGLPGIMIYTIRSLTCLHFDVGEGASFTRGNWSKQILKITMSELNESELNIMLDCIECHSNESMRAEPGLTCRVMYLTGYSSFIL